MTSAEPETNRLWPARRVGAILGAASAVTVFVLLAFRSQRFADLTDHSLSPAGLTIFVLLVAAGAIAGRSLAAANLVPTLRPLSAAALAVFFAVGPLGAGVVQVVLRAPALPLPEDAQIVQLERKPWGETTLLFGSPTEAQELYEHLVQTAKQNGWFCRKCKFQTSTGFGYANFHGGDPRTSKVKGYLEFEIAPSKRTKDALQSSDLTQVKVLSERRTVSVEWVALFMSLLVVCGLLFHLNRSINTNEIT